MRLLGAFGTLPIPKYFANNYGHSGNWATLENENRKNPGIIFFDHLQENWLQVGGIHGKQDKNRYNVKP